MLYDDTIKIAVAASAPAARPATTTPEKPATGAKKKK